MLDPIYCEKGYWIYFIPFNLNHEFIISHILTSPFYFEMAIGFMVVSEKVYLPVSALKFGIKINNID